MRVIAVVVWLVVGLAAPALAARAEQPAEAQRLAAFARSIGLREVEAFVDTVESLRRAARLPPRYATKAEARAHGWQGGGVCAAWPGHSIGGDVFHNFAARLPSAAGRGYREADLDATCRSRGPRRLIFSNDGLIYVTIDHYKSFLPVP